MMLESNEILKVVGFSEIPEKIKDLSEDNDEVSAWLRTIDFDQAIRYYGLDIHKKFMFLFKQYKLFFDNNNNFQKAAFILNNYLFSSDLYNWEHSLKRDTIDMFPAFILLSGYTKHINNMKKRGFDKPQIEKHKQRIYECCTIGIDTYKIDGMETSQLIWGSIFINTHIIELGRLQYEIKLYDYDLPNIKLNNEFCIGIHIPRGKRLDNVLVENSLMEAKKIIPHYFSELSVLPAFFINSWLLSCNLDDFLSPNSNIKLFRNRFDILQYGSHSSIHKFLFNSVSDITSEYPENTTLRFNIKQALLSGKKFYDGIGILK